MAIKNNPTAEDAAAGQNSGGLLDIDSNQFWWERLRPAFNGFNTKYGNGASDAELLRTIEKCINGCDGAMARHDKQEAAEQFTVIMSAFNDPSYFQNHFKTASDDEKDAVKDLKKKVEDFLLILKAEKSYYPPKEKPKNRVVEYIQDEHNAFGGYNADYYDNKKKMDAAKPSKPQLNTDKKGVNVDG